MQATQTQVGNLFCLWTSHITHMLFAWRELEASFSMEALKENPDSERSAVSDNGSF